MLVRDHMTSNPITVADTAPVLEAGEMMRRQKVSRLPVMHGDKLVGIVTDMDVIRVSPSAATTLSVFEINYLLSTLTLKDVMTKNPLTIPPAATLEEAAVLMRDNQIGALPVVENSRLVGIITESDIFDAFIAMMGLRAAGSRLTLDIEDKIGVLAEITRLIKELGLNIVTMATLVSPEGGHGELVLRLDTADPEPVVKELTGRGFRVIHAARMGDKS